MKVIAKFECKTVKTHEVAQDELGYEIELEPVTSGSEENEEFYKWTPGGKLVLETVNERAGAQFRPGKEYMLTIEEAEKAE